MNRNLALVAKFFPVGQQWQGYFKGLEEASINPQLSLGDRAIYANALDFSNCLRIIFGIAELAERPKRRRKLR